MLMPSSAKKNEGFFFLFCVVRFSGGVLSVFLFFFFICLSSFGFWSVVFYLLIKRTESLCCTITLGQTFLITEAPIPVNHFSLTIIMCRGTIHEVIIKYLPRSGA